ncbi:SGNH/GDSL hydrolase family protein [Geodermatophilus marinus]|uniref:SGNH/GDSL hydrolase family protein n=1 Tax=Geodermatophilus sp. LHW52908 TaxID=2303986 RepID=UPI000E3D3DBD|nr:SGNH/GDSL hydrolase family protein [Geodermatophilus sp. LHW52908]RFU19714.1 SGNH/GDSL hydrolase family protein [Geodermatophilus sp. LHW52908]
MTGPGRPRALLAAAAVLVGALALLLVPGVRGPLPPSGGELLAGRPLVAFLGDSWTRGAGATGRHGYAPMTADRLGWGWVALGVGGSGYSVPGPNDSTYGERVDAVLAVGADVVVVQGTLNERRGAPEALLPAAADTLTRLRAGAGPGTRVLVVGASHNPGTPPATIDRVNRALAAAAARAGVPFVDPAAQNWIDPADPAVWADPIHPNDRGHRLVADRLAPLLRDLVPH